MATSCSSPIRNVSALRTACAKAMKGYNNNNNNNSSSSSNSNNNNNNNNNINFMLMLYEDEVRVQSRV